MHKDTCDSRESISLDEAYQRALSDLYATQSEEHIGQTTQAYLKLKSRS